MPERKKPGPPKTKDRDPARSIRVPDDEWQRWGETARGKGLSIAAWLRQMANRSVARSQ